MKIHDFRYAYIYALCAFAGFNVAIAPSASADENADSFDEIVVVANRAPEPLSKIGNSVTVLSDVAIRESQATIVSDLLVQAPGVTFARTGGVGQPTSIFIRGAESDQTVVVIDGVQLNDPSTTGGGFNFANLLTGDISRIEILRGAQSTLYGSQAMGGVINIVTGEPVGPLGGGVTAEGGAHDTGYAAANVGGKTQGLLWRLSGNWYGTSGIPGFDARLGGKRADASQIGGGSGQLRYNLTPDLSVDVRGYYTQARTDFAGYDNPPSPFFMFGDGKEYGKTNQALGYAGFTLRSPDRALTNRVAFQYTNTETRNFDPDAPANYGSPSTETFYGIGRNQREEYQGTWELAPHFEAVFGALHERSTIQTDSPAFDYAGPMPLDNYATIDSGYAQLQSEVIAGLTLTTGGRYDRHNVYGGHPTGQVSAAWTFNNSHTILRASFGQGFKTPSLYQLYSNYGNIALQPELANSWDVGVEHHAWDGRLQLSATYFSASSRDLIEFFDCTTTPSPLCVKDPFGYYTNIARASSRGVEFQAGLKAADRLTLSANFTLTDAQDRSAGSATFGNQLPRRPKTAANASASYRWPSRFSAVVSARYAGRSFDDAANQIALGGYVLVDAKISYTLSDRLELYGRVENATDKHYETAYQYGTFGRGGFAGVRATF